MAAALASQNSLAPRIERKWSASGLERRPGPSRDRFPPSSLLPVLLPFHTNELRKFDANKRGRNKRFPLSASNLSKSGDGGLSVEGVSVGDNDAGSDPTKSSRTIRTWITVNNELQSNEFRGWENSSPLVKVEDDKNSGLKSKGLLAILLLVASLGAIFWRSVNNGNFNKLNLFSVQPTVHTAVLKESEAVESKERNEVIATEDVEEMAKEEEELEVAEKEWRDTIDDVKMESRESELIEIVQPLSTNENTKEVVRSPYDEKEEDISVTFQEKEINDSFHYFSDPSHIQYFEALKSLKIIENDFEPNQICSKRDYVRWLVLASNKLNKKISSKLFPSMFVEGIHSQVFDDVDVQDPDFKYIQGLAEAGIIPSRYFHYDYEDGLLLDSIENKISDYEKRFNPDDPLTREELISWKTALVEKNLSDHDLNELKAKSGIKDFHQVNKFYIPLILSDLYNTEKSISLHTFGNVRRLEPQKMVMNCQVASALTLFDNIDAISEEVSRIEAEKIAISGVEQDAFLENFEKQIKDEIDMVNVLKYEESEKKKNVESEENNMNLKIEKFLKEHEVDRKNFAEEKKNNDAERKLLEDKNAELRKRLSAMENQLSEIVSELGQIVDSQANVRVKTEEFKKLKDELLNQKLDLKNQSQEALNFVATVRKQTEQYMSLQTRAEGMLDSRAQSLLTQARERKDSFFLQSRELTNPQDFYNELKSSADGFIRSTDLLPEIAHKLSVSKSLLAEALAPAERGFSSLLTRGQAAILHTQNAVQEAWISLTAFAKLAQTRAQNAAQEAAEFATLLRHNLGEVYSVCERSLRDLKKRFID